MPALLPHTSQPVSQSVSQQSAPWIVMLVTRLTVLTPTATSFLLVQNSRQQDHQEYTKMLWCTWIIYKVFGVLLKATHSGRHTHWGTRDGWLTQLSGTLLCASRRKCWGSKSFISVRSGSCATVYMYSTVALSSGMSSGFCVYTRQNVQLLLSWSHQTLTRWCWVRIAQSHVKGI